MNAPADAAAPAAAPQRVLLGPGPSDVAPSVLRALAQPTVGHLDPWLFGRLEEIRSMLSPIFGTANERTLATSGTGTSAMEACLANLLEPESRALVGVAGYFGARLVDIARRHGAEVTAVEGEWGRPLEVERLREAAGGRRHAMLAVVHAETSTGVRQDLAGLRDLADEIGALLVVDAVTSLGCQPVELDRHGVDAAYSCTQKGLSCPPGLAPISFSSRAVEASRSRARPVAGFYLDLELLWAYWSGEHAYHHTISSNLLCGLHEAARLVLEEGLEVRAARHVTAGRALAAGLEEMGLELLVPERERLPQLTAVRIPGGVADAAVRRRLIAEHGIEIGGGLGPLKGRVWRIGLMGAGATRRNVLLGLAALRAALAAEGHGSGGDPLAAAEAVYAAQGPPPS